jgi:hypothetical protein
MHETNGNGIDIQNQSQKLLPRLRAINPATTGKKSGIKMIGIAKTTSIKNIF